jgi:hypothetical protein
MTAEPERHDEHPPERTERDPVGMQRDWLHATEEGSGQDTLNGAIDVAIGTDPDAPPAEGAREEQERQRAIRTQFG